VKKVLWSSGVAAMILLALLLSGLADADDVVKETLLRGNAQYAAAGMRRRCKPMKRGLRQARTTKR